MFVLNYISAGLPGQVHCSTCWRTRPILACPCLKMASPCFMEMKSCPSVPWPWMRAPSPGKVAALEMTTCFVMTRACVYRCVAVLGDLIPVRGRHYWEVEVEDRTEFRIGVAYEDTERSSYLGANNSSWCMTHILSPSRYKFLLQGLPLAAYITEIPLPRTNADLSANPMFKWVNWCRGTIQDRVFLATWTFSFPKQKYWAFSLCRNKPIKGRTSQLNLLLCQCCHDN